MSVYPVDRKNNYK